MRGRAAAGPRPRVVVISPAVPEASPGHAGGILLTAAVRALMAGGADVRVLVPATRRNREALAAGPPPARVELVGAPRAHRGPLRLALVAAHRLEPWISRLDWAMPPLALVVALLLDPRRRALLRGADVIDLQWEQLGRLAPVLRRLTPRARITCMLHDVLAQAFANLVAEAPTASAARRHGLRARMNRLLERRLARDLDAALVLSEKDADILLSVSPRFRPRIVRPPLVEDATPIHDVADRDPVAVLVSVLDRAPNLEAADRLVSLIWPRVLAAVPRARLLLVGRGLDPDRARGWAAVPGIEVTGFVPDLEAVYACARASIVPLRTGAGVKFKVVESLVRGIPTVTTTSGAEGIGGEDLLSTVSDEDVGLVAGLIAALTDPEAARRARVAAERVRARYGTARFARDYREAVLGPDGAGGTADGA